jgi:hypothetical protein
VSGPNAGDIELLERELGRHWRAVAKIMGGDFESFVDCPTCAEAGTPLAGRIPLWAIAQEPDYQTRTDTTTCENCLGLGMMRTGSKVPGQELLPCPTCIGTGYVQKAQPLVPVPDLAPALVQGEPDEAVRLRALGYTVLAPYRPSA